MIKNLQALNKLLSKFMWDIIDFIENCVDKAANCNYRYAILTFWLKLCFI